MNVLDKSVLVLNRLWQPINETNIETALTDLVKGTVKALDISWELDELGNRIGKCLSIVPVSFEEWVELPVRKIDDVIHSVKLTLRVPTVVLAANYSHMPVKTMGLTLANVARRDKNKCAYTGKVLSKARQSIDHITPKARGGKHLWKNVVLADRDINSQKGNKLNSEAGLRLLIVPTEPKPTPISATLNLNKHPDWELFKIN